MIKALFKDKQKETPYKTTVNINTLTKLYFGGEK